MGGGERFSGPVGGPGGVARHASEDWRSATPAYRALSRAVSGPVRGLARLRVRGLEHVPATGPALVVSNHASLADPIVINATIPRPTYWLAKSSIFENAAGAAAMRAFGCIKVDREAGGNEGAVAAAVRALAEGKLVGVFPEGTRSRPGQIRRGKTGVARIAALSGALVLPVGIDATDLWPRHAKLPRLGTRVYMAVGEPMRLDLKPEQADDKQALRDATDDVMERVRALFEDARTAKEEKIPW